MSQSGRNPDRRRPSPDLHPPASPSRAASMHARAVKKQTVSISGVTLTQCDQDMEPPPAAFKLRPRSHRQVGPA